MTGAMVATAARLLAATKVRWEGCEPSARQRVYFANHRSHLDFVIVWSVLPRQLRESTRPVGARDYWGHGRLRKLMATRVFDVLLIDRAPVPGNPDSMGLMLDVLDGGTSLILFPEGSRGSAEEPARFRSGLYNLALQRPDVEMVPVRLDNLGRVLPKGELIPLPLPTMVTFRPPICVEPGEGREAFLVRARAAVMPEQPA